MPDFDDRLRRDVPRLSERADPGGAFEEVAAKRRRRRRIRGMELASVVVVVALVAAGGGFALVRAFGSGPQPGAGGQTASPSPSASVTPSTPTPSESPTSSPSATPSESPSPSPIAGVPGYPPECEASQVTGDFDADGAQDTAIVSHGGCPPQPGQPIEDGWGILLTYGSPGAGGAWTLSDCATVCRAVEATDLNGDRIDELVLEVDGGASTRFVEIVSLPFTPTGPVVLTVEPPGAEGFPKQEPARFPVDGPVTHQSFLTCGRDGDPIVISTTAELNQEQTRYRVREVTFTITTDDGKRTGYRIAQSLAVHSSNETTVAFGTDIPVRGDPCWPQS